MPGRLRDEFGAPSLVRAGRPNRRWWLILLGALFVGAVLAVWSCEEPANERPDLEATLAAAAGSEGDGGTIDLAGVADFGWDRAYLFGPYTAPDQISEGLGFEWTPLSPFGGAVIGDLLMPSEGFALLVFVQAERDVTGWTLFNPYDAPPTVLMTIPDRGPNFVVMPRDEAVLAVRASDADGSRSWMLEPTTGR